MASAPAGAELRQAAALIEVMGEDFMDGRRENARESAASKSSLPIRPVRLERLGKHHKLGSSPWPSAWQPLARRTSDA
jgi:hypothetical protein